MKSIRWTAAVIALVAFAGTAMSQTDPASNAGSENAQGFNQGNEGATNAAPSNQAPGAENQGSSNISANGATKCHWWSFSKECREQRQYQRNEGSMNSGANSGNPSSGNY